MQKLLLQEPRPRTPCPLQSRRHCHHVSPVPTSPPVRVESQLCPRSHLQQQLLQQHRQLQPRWQLPPRRQLQRQQRCRHQRRDRKLRQFRKSSKLHRICQSRLRNFRQCHQHLPRTPLCHKLLQSRHSHRRSRLLCRNPWLGSHHASPERTLRGARSSYRQPRQYQAFHHPALW